MIDPLTGMEMTPQPPMPANQMGTAKPVFNQTAQNVGNQVYGTPFQRQMSMPQPPMFMKDIPISERRNKIMRGQTYTDKVLITSVYNVNKDKNR